MRSIALGFAGGAWCLQQAASLPDAATMGWLLAACAGLTITHLAFGVSYHSFSAFCSAPRLSPAGMAVIRCALVLFAAGIAGFDWAAWRAHQYARVSWPAAWEGRDVTLTGRIETMPVRAAAQEPWPGAKTQGRRGMPDWLVTLQVLQAAPTQGRSPRAVVRAVSDAGIAGRSTVHAANDPATLHDGPEGFTGRVQLRMRGVAAPGAAGPQAGDVWQMVGRLQRPHGLANFGLSLREASLFQRGIRATGSARAAVRVQPDAGTDAFWSVWRVRAGIERLRTHIGNRIDAVLEGKPHRGVVMALALGLQSAITADDRTRFTRTGTNHLVAVSGLHIGLAAAVAAWCTRRLLRVIAWRSWSAGVFWRARAVPGSRPGVHRLRPLLLMVPRQRIVGVVAIVAAGAFVALSGFGIPAQRAFWMVSAYCLTSIDGRRVGPTVIWSLALWLVVLVDPWAVLSAGGWLSFMAIGAIVYIASTIPHRVRPPRIDDDGVARALVDDTVDGQNTARFTLPVRPGEWRPLAGDDADARQSGDLPLFGVSRATVVPSAYAAPRPGWRAAIDNVVVALRDHGRRAKRWFVVAARLQLALSLALAPASLVWFGEAAVLGPLANLFAIPWVSLLAVPAVFCALVLPAPLDAAAWRWAHSAIAWLHQGLGVLIDGASFLSARFGVADMIRAPAPGLLVLSSACAGIALFLAPRTTSLFGMPQWARHGLSAALCLPVFCYRPAAPAFGDFRITMLDIGQGNAVVVETRAHRWLYDTGPPYGDGDNAGRRVIVPYLRQGGIAALDGLIVSHPHDDHYGGVFSVIDAVPVRYLLASWPADVRADALQGPASTARRGAAALPPLWQKAAAHGIVRRRCRAGDTWQWDGVRFDTLWPVDPAMRAPPNHTSCVLRITNGRHAVLLAGDIEAPQESALVAAGTDVRADVLLAPHHGSATSSTPAFIAAVSPDHVVFQAGFRNRHRHPNLGVVGRYTACGIAQYRSDADGAVRFTSRGPTLAVETVRRDHGRYWMTRLTETSQRLKRPPDGSLCDRAPTSGAGRRHRTKQGAANTDDE
jgi:competence protein ComEC